MSARPSNDEGGRTQAGPINRMDNGTSSQRSVPERSRTLSSSELHRDSNAKPGALQYAATTPIGSFQPSSSGTSSSSLKNGTYAMSRSEDGHSTTARGLQYDPAGPPPPSFSQTLCASCGEIVTGQFVRALGVVFHRACFTCRDCNTPVAQKFFPVDGPDGRQYPLCETDYFRRLGLLCANCGLALRGSYITACNKKYHIEHFACSIPTCPTLFGPSDSYYEHEDSVYCHFHYSTRFANKCAGCNTAILKQFVEVNRNMKEDCYHPECYLCHKFWNVKLYAGPRPNSTAVDEASDQTHSDGMNPTWQIEEASESPDSIRVKQATMEKQVYQIWTILSAFEESSAACISDMLRNVSDGQYLDAIRNAEKFILHVEVLFAAIDDLEYYFAAMNLKGMSHVREARVLCKKTVDLFTLLQKPNRNQGGMTQELLALVTGLAHYLKVLIRIALTATLKLDREHGKEDSIPLFLDSLNALLMHRGSTAARRLLTSTADQEDGGVAGTRGVLFGYKSLAPEYAGESPFWPLANGRPPVATMPLSDCCVVCQKTIEEDCVRLGTYQRWHSHCIKCVQCERAAGEPAQPPRARTNDEKEAGTRPSTVRRPPAPTDDFAFDLPDGTPLPHPPLASGLEVAELITTTPIALWCIDHKRDVSLKGFQSVTRLEQYAFLLNVALRRLYILLKRPGIIPDMPAATEAERQARRESSEITPVRSVHHLDRKLSATSRIPKRSTIIESPNGSIAQAATSSSQKYSEMQRPPNVTTLPSSQKGLPHAPMRQRSLQTMAQTTAQPSSLYGPASPVVGPPSSYSGSSYATSRPTIPHTNTQVHIIDHPTPQPPQSPSYILPADQGAEDGLTLADIPQLIEAQQNRTLPTNGRPYISELSPQELQLIKYAALLILARSPLNDSSLEEEMIEFLEAKKAGFWNKLFKGDKKNVKKKGVFCVPLELLAEREGVDSMQGVSTTTPVRVPSFVEDIVLAMRQMDMSVEGIFRKNGNIRRMNQVIESMDRDPSSVDLTQDNPVQLAALLKRFLRDLPDPLMTYKLHRLWITTQTVPDPHERARLLHMVTLLLPRYHRDTLEVLLLFLKWVASFSHVDEETGSKMDLGNLATVITPSILKANKRDGVRDESFPGIRVVTELLELQDAFLLTPEEFVPLLHDQNYFMAYLDQPRELMKKIDTFFRLRNISGPSTFSPSSNINGNKAPPPIPPVFPQSGPTSSRGQYDHPSSSGSNGQYHDRVIPDYAGKQLPPHPGLTHHPFSLPQPLSSRMNEAVGNSRPSLDGYWTPPTIPASGSGRESPRSRPSSFLKSLNDSGLPFGGPAPPRNPTSGL